MNDQLYKKIIEVQRKVTHVEKDARNESQRYDYVSSAFVVARLRTAMTEAGIVLRRSIEDVQYTERERVDSKTGAVLPAGTLATIRMRFMLYDVDGGGYYEDTMVFCGMDHGDKHIAKAITSGTKYFLMGAFNLSTQEDIEADESIDKQGPTKPRAVEAPTQKPVDDDTAKRSEIVAWFTHNVRPEYATDKDFMDAMRDAMALDKGEKASLQQLQMLKESVATLTPEQIVLKWQAETLDTKGN